MDSNETDGVVFNQPKQWGELRAVAQLFKFWRGCRNATVPISSFHIEMVLASEGVCTGVKSYAECITELLQKMAEQINLLISNCAWLWMRQRP